MLLLVMRGYTIQPNSLALSFAAVQASARNSMSLIPACCPRRTTPRKAPENALTLHLRNAMLLQDLRRIFTARETSMLVAPDELLW
jgi:hypothetical protein